jgi:L-fuconolactonase
LTLVFLKVNIFFLYIVLVFTYFYEPFLMTMMKIDAHQHFWHYDKQNYAWIDDKMQVIQKDFLPENLEPILQKNGFDACVLVQVNQSEEENHYCLKFAELYDFIKGIVGWIDLKAKNLEERLTFFKNFEKLKGFRHIVQGEPVGFMQEESFKNGLQLLAKFNFTYDFLIYPKHLKDTLAVVRECKDNKFVIDHLAKPEIKDKKISQWANYIRQIAQYENVFCKISGMVTEAHWQNWEKEDFYIYLDYILEFFGVQRIMYGSDWPVCLVAATYEQQLEIVESYFAQLSAHEKSLIFGKNALDFYHL